MPAACRSRHDSTVSTLARPYFSYRKIVFQMLRNIPALTDFRARQSSSLINEVSSDILHSRPSNLIKAAELNARMLSSPANR